MTSFPKEGHFGASTSEPFDIGCFLFIIGIFFSTTTKFGLFREGFRDGIKIENNVFGYFSALYYKNVYSFTLGCPLEEQRLV